MYIYSVIFFFYFNSKSRSIKTLLIWWHIPLISTLGKQRRVDIRVEDQPSLHSQPRFQIMILFHQKMKILKPGIFLKLKDTNIIKGSFLLLWKCKSFNSYLIKNYTHRWGVRIVVTMNIREMAPLLRIYSVLARTAIWFPAPKAGGSQLNTTPAPGYLKPHLDCGHMCIDRHTFEIKYMGDFVCFCLFFRSTANFCALKLVWCNF